MTQISNAEKQLRFRKKEHLKRCADNIFNLWVGSPQRFRNSKRTPEEVRYALNEAVKLPSDWTQEDYDYAQRKLGQYHLDLISSEDQIARDVNGDWASRAAEFLRTPASLKLWAEKEAEIDQAWALAAHIISALKISSCTDVSQAAALMEALRFVGRLLASKPEIHCSQATAVCLALIGPQYERPTWFAATLAKTIRDQMDDELGQEVGKHLIQIKG